MRGAAALKHSELVLLGFRGCVLWGGRLHPAALKITLHAFKSKKEKKKTTKKKKKKRQR